jgi:hypothetical protein
MPPLFICFVIGSESVAVHTMHLFIVILIMILKVKPFVTGIILFPVINLIPKQKTVKKKVVAQTQRLRLEIVPLLTFEYLKYIYYQQFKDKIHKLTLILSIF